ncbi:hypothetical protein SI65_09211 [Aspergillus cristatus]|uniref:UTP23 sensor motif region domain-containing protein n=1 Tax=Aspergillus cristatus TaxID=573508 RepID=A0A1E3B2T9_ASPCR|nr:hypothetical protein SI65_09211 [Aspergillus cristatus]
MRAKRSKKYRKLMHQYELAFNFREPYQVLVDSNFLRATHSFKMEIIPALERTLQGKVKPLLTKCSLAAVMASQPINPRTNAPYRPDHLPPPTVVPLRHCSHNEDDTPIDENDCLLSLFSPSPDSNSKKNKEHYILATADPQSPEKVVASTQGDHKKKKRAEMDAVEAVRKSRALRAQTRAIPGVPIVYVKRSVMVLEPMSVQSEGVRDGFEQGKFRVGLGEESSLGKRKRDGEGGGEGEAKKKKNKKVKGPNPLSVKKPKKREQPAAQGKKHEQKPVQKPKESEGGDAPEQKEGDSSAPKPKRRRRHHSKKEGGGDGGDGGDGAEPSNDGPADSMDVE